MYISPVEATMLDASKACHGGGGGMNEPGIRLAEEEAHDDDKDNSSNHVGWPSSEGISCFKQHWKRRH
jgi:hypothetical protein